MTKGSPESGVRAARQARGIVVMLVFAGAWAVIGTIGLLGPDLVALAGVSLVVVLSFVATRALMRRTGRAPPARRVAGNADRVYRYVNLAQGALSVSAAVTLVSVGAVGLVPAAVCLITGLHFFPLAWSYGQSQFWAAGTSMALLAVVALVLAGTAGAGSDVTVGLVGAGSAVILWATSLSIAARG